MTLGFVMMCHTALDRAAQVARHWAEADCPVVIHVDSKVSAGNLKALVDNLADLANIRFSPRYDCEWGTWSLVQATQDATKLMLADFPEVAQVFLASGSCLPLRPVAELKAYMAARPETDFIESVTTADVGWTVGGLDSERFTLRFPFSWRKRREWFDKYVALQRRVGLRRKIPDAIVPHLGSQWWCLTRRSLTAIFDAPDAAEMEKYFRHVWIPDESYFQTLVRRYSDRIESRSLTLSKFDFQGRPHIFYDDHLALLRRSNCFVARKVWSHSDQLYAEFLAPGQPDLGLAEPNPSKIERLFAKAVDRRLKGRAGLYMQSRFPGAGRSRSITAAPYSVFQGFSELFTGFDDWLAGASDTRVHGHLFAQDRAEFAGEETIFSGGMSDSARLRDYNPKSFLSNMIWNSRGERQCFQFGPDDVQKISSFVASDVNAQISIISGAFAVPLFRSNGAFDIIRSEAARLQKIEAEFLALLRQPDVRAKVRIWTLAEFIENPLTALQTVIDEINPRAMRRLKEIPKTADLAGFGLFLQKLRNQGMQPALMGDFPIAADVGPTAEQTAKR